MDVEGNHEEIAFQSLLKEKYLIGWDSFLLGFWRKALREIQSKYFLEKGSKIKIKKMDTASAELGIVTYKGALGFQEPIGTW